ncbi:hypothetical protein CEXT_783711 [Caerostris extrusa]|uniref:Uncharacterized protein n=1 Tax=Caerostris extrusa TaxID=172846 RepID=A0AAV4NVY2_CAEEX|nr:hypothetical protein CEXT_783711 [Caerostris extrusa]
MNTDHKKSKSFTLKIKQFHIPTRKPPTPSKPKVQYPPLTKNHHTNSCANLHFRFKGTIPESNKLHACVYPRLQEPIKYPNNPLKSTGQYLRELKFPETNMALISAVFPLLTSYVCVPLSTEYCFLEFFQRNGDTRIRFGNKNRTLTRGK